MEKEIWKKCLNGLFLVAVFALTVWTVFRGEDFKEVVSFLITAELKYVIPSIFCVLLFIFGEATIICYLFRMLGLKISIFRCCMYSFIGFFYSCVTPSASGGQPMQVIAMHKDKIPAARSTVVLAIVTITYKLVLVLIGITVLLIRPEGIMKYLETVEPIIYVGLVLNVICIAILFLLVFHPGAIRICVECFFSIRNRIRPKKNTGKHKEKLENIISQYTGTAEFFKTNSHVIIHVLLITFVQRFVLFFITWLTYCAFQLSGEHMSVVVTLQAMISVASDMLPLPGGMGVSENLFLEIFQPIFGEDFVIPGMVISRGISYYSQMLISGVMTFLSVFIISGKKRRENNK